MTTSQEKIQALLSGELAVVNVGLSGFAEALCEEGATALQVDWSPPCGGDATVFEALERCLTEEGVPREPIVAANEEAVKRVVTAKPVVIDIGVAEEVIPGMHRRLVLHAGPPVSWAQMSGPTRGAVMGGLVHEGLAASPQEAAELAASGEISFAPCHDHQAVGPMAGVVTASMPVWVIENETFGNRAFCTLNEGLGKVLRYGAYGPEVMDRLAWMKRVLAPGLKEALRRHGRLDLRSLVAQALQMGDEVHNRNRAATSLVIRALAPHLAGGAVASRAAVEILRFLDGNDHFFLNLSMPACKSALDTASGIKHATLVTAMARNGTEFGLRVAGLAERWFTAPAPQVEGLYLSGFGPSDAASDIGDSAITESGGLGGFAMAAAPAIVQFVGGSAAQAVEMTGRMYHITLAEHPTYKIPALDFRGTPVGIDLLKVVEQRTVPVVNTGIAHKEPGVGMIGAGLVRPPTVCFHAALVAFAEHYFSGEIP